MFIDFKAEMQQSFDKMIKDEGVIYTTDVDKEQLWETYLNSFSDPVERQAHNCNCCRQFIKNYGGLVAIKEQKMVSIWNFTSSVKNFEHVPTNLNNLVMSANVKNIFIAETAKLGVNSNKQTLEDGSVITWNHLFYLVPNNFVHKSSKSIDTLLSEYDSTKHVFKRSLEEINLDALETVSELISQGSIYRGNEFQKTVEDFILHKKQYDKALDKDLFVWKIARNIPLSVSKIKNSAIGTLLEDISKGKELDKAVEAFEKIMAPANYKRPAAIITQSMIKEAEKTIEELGLKESLERKFATPEDISINNLLFVDRDSKTTTGMFEELTPTAPVNSKSFSKIEEVSAEVFINDILPTTKSIEVLFENEHLANLSSIIAPQNLDAPNLFKWNNNFSWSYTNAMTDSIKELVKAAGGSVTGELRVSLSWFNGDDLDLHVYQPDGQSINYSSFKKPAVTKQSGQLDVDMNAGSTSTRTPVENITWSDINKIGEGTYKVIVNNFSKRETVDFGFTLQVESKGEIFNFHYNKPLSNKENVLILEFNYSKTNGVSIIKNAGTATSGIAVKEKWGLSTGKFEKVSMIMKSPNHWEGSIGNKHLFFVLENAKNDEKARGFFNEFLRDDLMKNKRVFEVLGSKLQVPPSEKQLSGLGFSETQRKSLICKVEGKFKRTIKVNF